jgi:hypothetical protein
VRPADILPSNIPSGRCRSSRSARPSVNRRQPAPPAHRPSTIANVLGPPLKNCAARRHRGARCSDHLNGCDHRPSRPGPELPWEGHGRFCRHLCHPAETHRDGRVRSRLATGLPAASASVPRMGSNVSRKPSGLSSIPQRLWSTARDSRPHRLRFFPEKIFRFFRRSDSEVARNSLAH